MLTIWHGSVVERILCADTKSGKFVEYPPTRHAGIKRVTAISAAYDPYSDQLILAVRANVMSLLASFDLRDSLREYRAASKGMICTASTNYPLLLLTGAQILHTFTKYSLPISPGHPTATCSDIGLACIFVKLRE